MKTKTSIYLMVLMILMGNCAYAQSVFSSKSNAPRSGDILVCEKIQLDSISDLYHSRLNGEKYLDAYVQNGEDSIVRIFRRSRHQFKYNNDSLFLLSVEDNLRKRTYEKPRLERLFPLDRMKFFDEKFRSEIEYCNNISFCQEGSKKTTCRKIPFALLPNGDTLKYVMVYSVKEDYFVSKKDSSGIDSISVPTHYIENREWLYAVGYRYPIVERFLFCEAEKTDVPIIEVAYYYEPESLLGNLEDNINDTIRESTGRLLWEDYNDWSKNIVDISPFVTINSESQTVTFSFCADCPTSGRLVFSDASGRVYRSNSFVGVSGEQISTTLDYSGLRKGAYVLHVKLNTNIYQCTVYVK